MKSANAIFLILFLYSAICSCKRNRAYEAMTDERKKPDEEVKIIGVPQNIFSENDSSLVVSIPNNIKAQMLIRIAYIVSYNRDTRNPNWVSWQLTKEHTDGPYSRNGVPYYDENGFAYGIGAVTIKTVKNGYFLDMESEEPRQNLSDWSRDYNMSHGHMCPAGDNKWDKSAMNQSFLLTNMCPQDEKLNGGAWQKLEEKCRRWANKYGSIYIVAGPIFYNAPSRFLGQIAIPDAFFKVVLCLSGNPKAIGFIYENSSISQSMNNAYCTIDHVEELTGYDFFEELEDNIEQKIESHCNFNDWK